MFDIGYVRISYGMTCVSPLAQLAEQTELVKVAGVAPTKLQELEGGSQSQPTT